MSKKQIFLLPGEMAFSREPVVLATLLGSCVAVCLYNRKYKFGAMNHYMLATSQQGDNASGRHGDYSTKMLIRMMCQEDRDVYNLDATIIGGGQVTESLSSGRSIGANNIMMARLILEKRKIKIVNTHVGGLYGRKVYFQNWNGNIEIRKIQKSEETAKIESKKRELSRRKIRVLIVDDSKTIRDLLAKAIELDPDLEVVGMAEDAYHARELFLEKDPDVITLDIIMPKTDGITFLKKLFVYKPKPTIVISTVAQKGSKIREQVSAIGAVDVLDKEELKLYEGIEHVSSILTAKIKRAAAMYLKKKTKEEVMDI